jgi:hypothetical protein
MFDLQFAEKITMLLDRINMQHQVGGTADSGSLA